MEYNGDFLWPTIFVDNRDKLSFIINNKLIEDTIVHWHGLHFPAEYDGGPHKVIKAGSIWKPQITIKEQTETLWYLIIGILFISCYNCLHFCL